MSTMHSDHTVPDTIHRIYARYLDAFVGPELASVAGLNAVLERDLRAYLQCDDAQLPREWPFLLSDVFSTIYHVVGQRADAADLLYTVVAEAYYKYAAIPHNDETERGRRTRIIEFALEPWRLRKERIL